MAVASAYLGDVAGVASKAQLLSSYEAALFAGLGLGPLLGASALSRAASCRASALTLSSSSAGSAIFRYASLGPRAPYVLMLIFNAAYLSSFAFMPESLPPSRRARTAAPPSQPDTLAQRLLAVPARLVRPFKVLVPRKVDDGKRRDGRLLLVAVSGALLLVDTVRRPAFTRDLAPQALLRASGPPLLTLTLLYRVSCAPSLSSCTARRARRPDLLSLPSLAATPRRVPSRSSTPVPSTAGARRGPAIG